MFRQILVPLDGSRRAEHAIPIAAQMAQAQHGSLVLLRVVTPAIEWWPASLALPASAQIATASACEEASAYLDTLLALPWLQHCPVEPLVVVGPVVSTLLDVARTHECDAIILCTRDHESLSYRVSRSVTREVLRHTALPVLILHEHGPHPHMGPDQTQQPLRLYVAANERTHARSVFQATAFLARVLAAGRTVVHLVGTVQISPAREPLERRLSSAQEHLQAIKDSMFDDSAGSHLPVTWSLDVGSDITDLLVRRAENREASEKASTAGAPDAILLLMKDEAYGTTPWPMGDVIERVLVQTNLPLLVIEANEQRSKEGRICEGTAARGAVLQA
ncbi:hypothetical protein KSD_54310 [Ktedonobacter sp. SOSP1-85]|nr:universal stress protein [Ktedonobacter sp. SOSP1-85]GHO77660.1 hypothetical protein KSD_54310 [Ktedonobacter sp. SOSP1-85]